MLIPHKVKNKGKYISFHYLRGWKARKIRKVQEISPQIPICVSGTDLAIYEAAGKEKLLAERANIGKIARGDIAVTGAYNLKAKYIIHTVGPVWTDGLHHEFEILKHFMESLLC